MLEERSTPTVDAAPFVGGELLSAALTPGEAVEALAAAFADRAADGMPARRHLDVPGGELLDMPAFGPGGVAVKLVTICPGNAGRGLPLIHGLHVLFAPDTLRPEALIDGAALTAVRTAAVSALATDRLARPDARRLVIFGAGAQARAHVPAMLAVRPIAELVVVGRDRARAGALVALGRELGLEARAGRPEDVAAADIVCTCTTSAQPLFAGDRLAPGAHVNAVGAYKADRRELEGALMGDATVVVEARAPALAEAGDLMLAIAEGHMTADDIAGDLGEVVRGVAGRRHDAERTVFKSVGLPVEDLVVARAAVDRLRAQGRLP